MNTWFGALVYPLGLIAYGWTVEQQTFVVFPEISTFFSGLGMIIVFSTVMTYLVDAVPGRSSSAVALNNLIRTTLGCIGVLVGNPLIDALGNELLFTILGSVS